MIHFGYYGKTVHRGDFVRFNLPQSFVTVWDDWLQTLIINGETTHSENWTEIYDQSDSYRFTLSSGIAGNAVWAGLLVPSVDKVGRRFPFCLSIALPEGHTPVSAQTEFDSWFVLFENLALEIQNEAFDFDTLQSRMSDLADQHRVTPNSNAPESFSIGNTGSDDQACAIRASSSGILDSVGGQAQMLHALLTQSYFQYSIWTTSTSNHNESNTLVSGGLPVDGSGLALFDRNWEKCGCGNLIVADSSNIAYDDSLLNSTDQPTPYFPDTEDVQIKNSSTGDWPALEEDMQSSPEDLELPTPSVEPLELEEDNTTDAPWDK